MSRGPLLPDNSQDGTTEGFSLLATGPEPYCALRLVCPSLPDSISEVSYQHLFLGRKSFDVVAPELKHLAPLLSVFGAVVDAPNPFYLMVECLLNYVGSEALFMQQRRTSSPEIVNRKRRNFEGNAPHGLVHRVV